MSTPLNITTCAISLLQRIPPPTKPWPYNAAVAYVFTQNQQTIAQAEKTYPYMSRAERQHLASINSLRRVARSVPIIVLEHGLSTAYVAALRQVPMLQLVHIKSALPPDMELLRNATAPAGPHWRHSLLKLATPYILRDWKLVLAVDADTFFIRSPEPLFEDKRMRAPALSPYNGRYGRYNQNGNWTWPPLSRGGNSGVVLYAPKRHLSFSASLVCLAHNFKDIACSDQSILSAVGSKICEQAASKCSPSAPSGIVGGADTRASFCAAIAQAPPIQLYALPSFAHVMGGWEGIDEAVLSVEHKPTEYDPVVLHRCCRHQRRNGSLEGEFEMQLISPV